MHCSFYRPRAFCEGDPTLATLPSMASDNLFVPTACLAAYIVMPGISLGYWLSAPTPNPMITYALQENRA